MALVKPNYYFKNGFVYHNEAPVIEDNGVITINYLLSTQCQLNCVYCIAQDIIKNYSVPTLEEVNKAIETIIKLDPLVTVISGGEPLLSPHLKYVVERLSGRTNIILDTNGLLLSNKDNKFLLEHNVILRISMDMPDDINEITRNNPFHKTTTVLNKNLKYLNDNDYGYIISTVISNYNVDGLHAMLVAAFLHAPVIGWRLQNIIPCHNIDFSKYVNDSNNKPQDFREIKRQLIEELAKYRRLVPHREFIMKISDSSPSHSTVLLLPDGSLSISCNNDKTRKIISPTQIMDEININHHQEHYVINKSLY